MLIQESVAKAACYIANQVNTSCIVTSTIVTTKYLQMKPGNPMVIIGGFPLYKKVGTNLMKISEIKEG